jgi:hypothetical protein
MTKPLLAEWGKALAVPHACMLRLRSIRPPPTNALRPRIMGGHVTRSSHPFGHILRPLLLPPALEYKGTCVEVGCVDHTALMKDTRAVLLSKLWPRL